jgi:hypothetical protein
MPQGLQVWDASGNIVMDTTTWCSQVLGSVALGSNHGAGSVVDANLALGRPFFFVQEADSAKATDATGNANWMTVSVSGTTLNYAAGQNAAVIVYGIY